MYLARVTTRVAGRAVDFSRQHWTTEPLLQDAAALAAPRLAAYHEQLARLCDKARERGGRPICVTQASHHTRKMRETIWGVEEESEFMGRPINGVDFHHLLDLINEETIATCREAGAIVVDPLVWYRKHGESDIRHLAMNGEHILRLLQVYRDAFPRRLSATDRALFYGYTGYWLFTLYRLVPPESRPPLRPFVFRAWREGLYDPRWSAGYGRKRLIRLMLTGRA